MEGELSSSRIFHPNSISPYLATFDASTGVPGLCSSTLAFSSNIVAHRKHPNSSPLISQSCNAGIFSPRPILQQPSASNYPGISTEATRFPDPFGGVQNYKDSANVDREQIHVGSIEGLNEFAEEDEWWKDFLNGDLGDITANGITADSPQMVGSGAARSSSNFPTHQPTTNQSFPSHSRHPRPTSCAPAAANAPSSKTRRRWTVELHDHFVDAVNQLGGCEKAKPKAILELMSVEGLTLTQVKSHLQKYRDTHCGHGSSEGTSEKRSTPKERPPLDLQTGISFTEALRMQMRVQKTLHKQLEIQRTMQLKIEKQLIYIQKFEKRQKLAGASALSCEVVSSINSDGSTENGHAETSGARVGEDGPVHACDMEKMPGAGSHGDAGANTFLY